ncbi:MAG: transglycosylase SLT domain-containing protein [Firmicutes bacterium]|nr:transglycosylase SLT domain-containing protein [Bacillota bacterium]
MDQDELRHALARETARRGLWWLAAAVGGAWVAGGILLVVVAVTVIGALFGAGGYYSLPKAPPLAAPDVRAAAWAPAMPRGPLPSAVLAGVVAHESGGLPLAQNYNCSNGLSSPVPCGEYYHPGALGIGGAHTLSEDAGLGQINSGHWPIPPAPGWTSRGLDPEDPFEPRPNLRAAEVVLAGDMARCGGLLAPALAAYNSGGCQGDAAYVQADLAQIEALERGPVVAAWSTAWRKGAWRWQTGGTWIVVAASAPQGARWQVPLTRQVVCHADGHKAPRCKAVVRYLAGRALAMPSAVAVDGHAALRPGAPQARDCPVWPGEAAWCYLARRPGTYRVVARWAHGAMARTVIRLR